MRKLITPLLVVCLFVSIGHAQYFEAGAFVGSSNYRGDLNVDYLEPSEYNLAFGVFGRYRMSKYAAVKMHAYKGSLTGSDSSSPSLEERVRNLHFRSDLFELGITGEYYFGGLAIREDKISAPYIFAGIAAFYHNPQTSYKGQWVDLNPLGTEGQMLSLSDTDPYKLTQISIPFGIGFHFSLNEKHNIGLEFGVRKTFTDYLDDVSTEYPDIDKLRRTDPKAAALSFRTPEYYDKPMENPVGTSRGNADNNDWYFFFGANYSINMTDKAGLEWDEKYRAFDAAMAEKRRNKVQQIIESDEVLSFEILPLLDKMLTKEVDNPYEVSFEERMDELEDLTYSEAIYDNIVFESTEPAPVYPKSINLETVHTKNERNNNFNTFGMYQLLFDNIFDNPNQNKFNTIDFL